MLNSQGLGEMVSRKKDAYQSNPQALQQRYQQSQELVDLLALQQLKSEKEAAARNMQMQMQQNPATIAQQREQEVLGMIKQEQGRKLGDVAQRTAGTLGQINKKAQQNVQRTAKQGLPAMGGPRKPAMMAGGGIVAFFEGSEEPVSAVSEEEISEYLSQFKQLDTPRNREMAKKDILTRKAQEARSAARTQALAGKTPGAGSRRAQRQFVKEYDPTAALGGPPKTEPSAAPTKRTTPDMGGRGVLAPEPPKSDSDDAQPQGLEALGLASPTPTPTVVGTARQDIARTLLEDTGIKPEGTRAEARQAAEDRTKGILEAAIGREEGKLGPKESQLQRMQELQAQQTDPDKLRRQRLTAGLLGAAGRGSTALAGFGAGAFNQRVQQEAAARKNLTDQFGIENEKIQLDLDIAGSQIQSGQDAVEVLAKDQRAVAAALQGAAADDVKIAIAEGNRKFDADMQGAKTKLELFLDQMENRRAAAEQAADKELAYAELAAEFLQAKADLQKEILGDAGFDRASSEEQVNAAITRLEIMTIEFTQMLEKAGINDFEASIQERAGTLSGSASGKTSNGINLNPDLTALVDRLAQ
jgi:hypothetical protein